MRGEVVSSSVEAELSKQHNRQYEGRRTFNARVANIVCDRQRKQKQAPSHSELKKKATKSHREPL